MAQMTAQMTARTTQTRAHAQTFVVRSRLKLSCPCPAPAHVDDSALTLRSPTKSETPKGTPRGITSHLDGALGGPLCRLLSTWTRACSAFAWLSSSCRVGLALGGGYIARLAVFGS